MFTLFEKIYLLKILKQKRGLFSRVSKQDKAFHDQIITKLEQMIRNEQVNKNHL